MAFGLWSMTNVYHFVAEVTKEILHTSIRDERSWSLLVARVGVKEHLVNLIWNLRVVNYMHFHPLWLNRLFLFLHYGEVFEHAKSNLFQNFAGGSRVKPSIKSNDRVVLF